MVVEKQERTLIITRRVVTEIKTALAGKVLEVFARSKASMAAFRSAFCLDRLDFMVERGGGERTAQHEDGSGPRKDERQFFRDAPCRQTRLVKRICGCGI